MTHAKVMSNLVSNGLEGYINEYPFFLEAQLLNIELRNMEQIFGNIPRP